MTSELARQASWPLFRIVYLLFSINPPQYQKSIEINYSYIYQSFLHHFYKCTRCSRACYSHYNVALLFDPLSTIIIYTYFFYNSIFISLISRRSIVFYRSSISLFESFFLFILRCLLQLLQRCNVAQSICSLL